MTTQPGTVAEPTTSDAVGAVEPEILHLDPDIAALIAEVDAILSATRTPARRPPAPPATGCALVGPRSAGRSFGAPVRPRRGPVHPVWAVQRGPPTRQQPATKVHNPT
jgi:hypothetical protein